MAAVSFSEKKAKSILTDIAVLKIEGDHVPYGQYRSPLAYENIGRNSHTYRSDIPLINDQRSYKAYLFDLSTTLSRKLNERQYMAVIAYFSHAKITMQDVSDKLGYGRESIGNAVKKAIDIVSEVDNSKQQ
ncbi:MAG: hypothetical protein ACI9O6_001425 [Glaciecola sp.]|jgi:hypothetical protein